MYIPCSEWAALGVCVCGGALVWVFGFGGVFFPWWLNNISYWIRHEDVLLQAPGNLIFIPDLQLLVWAWVSSAHFAVDIFFSPSFFVVPIWMKVLWGRDCSSLSICTELSTKGAGASIRLFNYFYFVKLSWTQGVLKHTKFYESGFCEHCQLELNSEYQVISKLWSGRKDPWIFGCGLGYSLLSHARS